MHHTNANDPTRRHILLTALLLVVGTTAPALAADKTTDAAPWNALRAGGIVLFRHANAPGIGDPPGFRLGDCSTQRNLDAAGRAQARRIGARMREQGVTLGKVLTSQWCRTRETAELAFAGRVTPEAAFNSFFQDRENASQQTDAARALLLAWNGPGALVVVTHQVNISALVDGFTASAEGIVLRPLGQLLEVVGRIQP